MHAKQNHKLVWQSLIFTSSVNKLSDDSFLEYSIFPQWMHFKYQQNPLDILLKLYRVYVISILTVQMWSIFSSTHVNGIGPHCSSMGSDGTIERWGLV